MRVAVIGAGAAGLTTAKALLEVGIEPVVFEAAERPGGLWLYGREDAPAYRSLHTNTSVAVTAFSDLPFPAGTPHFPSWETVVDYLCAYVDRFGLERVIRYGCKVDAVQCAGNGRWSLRILSADGRSTEEFDRLFVCAGIFRAPFLPSIAETVAENLQTLHSMHYRTPDPFRGRDVLVVGLGSSAVDIAVDLVGTARRVTLSVRRGAWIVPRMVGGRPLDHRNTRLAALLPERFRASRRLTLVTREYARRGIPSPAEVWKSAGILFDPATAPGVSSDRLLGLIHGGAITAVPELIGFEANQAIFAGGSRRPVDTVIFCTGYRLDFPFLPAALRPWQNVEHGLYRLVFAPNSSTVAFVGLCRASGPIFPIVEMQARWAARVLTGETVLPPTPVMEEEIRGRWERAGGLLDPLIRVPLVPYCDEIGSLIGVRRGLLRHPTLLPWLLAGPPAAAQYRIDGPNPWDGVARAVRRAGRPLF